MQFSNLVGNVKRVSFARKKNFLNLDMLQEYLYDVAFSFLQADEKTVIELNDLIKGKLATFVYSERQKELAGADGEKVFNETFQKDARIVVVLYRDNWGKTKWTRIEETAIKNRGYDEGYDFLFVINLDTKSTLPPWIPKTYIWHNYERFKAESAVAIIEHKVTEKGGSVKKETIKDIAERSQRLKIVERDRDAFLQSDDAVVVAMEEVLYIARKVQSIKEEIDQTSDHPLEEGTVGYLQTPGPWFEFGGYSIYDTETSLVLTFYNNIPFHGGAQSGKLTVSVSRIINQFPNDSKKEILKSAELRFDRDLHENNGWSEHSTAENFMSSDDLIDTWIKEFFKALDEHHKRPLYSKDY